MRVKNVSARLHHVGEVSIAPGQEADIPKAFEASINRKELVPVTTGGPRFGPAKTDPAKTDPAKTDPAKE
jgi:hypothetical protein